MGRAKTGVNASMSAELPVQQGLRDVAGRAVEDSGNGCSAMATAGSVFSSSPSEIPSDTADADETIELEYEVPSWAEFRTYVMDNGNKYVRATYPNPPVDLIETIWCGVPVEHHEHARVMTAQREWLVY